jgi:hypothetical protein
MRTTCEGSVANRAGSERTGGELLGSFIQQVAASLPN